MANHNDLLEEYWYTDISSSYSDVSHSQDTDTQVIDIVTIFIGLVLKEVLSYETSIYEKTPIHMSALTDKMWVLELLYGHPE